MWQVHDWDGFKSWFHLQFLKPAKLLHSDITWCWVPVLWKAWLAIFIKPALYHTVTCRSSELSFRYLSQRLWTFHRGRSKKIDPFVLKTARGHKAFQSYIWLKLVVNWYFFLSSSNFSVYSGAGVVLQLETILWCSMNYARRSLSGLTALQHLQAAGFQI